MPAYLPLNDQEEGPNLSKEGQQQQRTRPRREEQSGWKREREDGETESFEMDGPPLQTKTEPYLSSSPPNSSVPFLGKHDDGSNNQLQRQQYMYGSFKEGDGDDQEEGSGEEGYAGLGVSRNGETRGVGGGGGGGGDEAGSSTNSSRNGGGGEEREVIWTTGAKAFLLSIGGFVGTTLVLIVALEIVQSKSSQATISKINTLLQIPTIFCQIFLLISAFVAVRSKNLVGIIGVVGLNIYLVLAGLLEASQRTSTAGKLRDRIYPEPSTPTPKQIHAILTFLWLIPGLDAAFHLGVDWAAWRLYKELGWSAYKKVSASIELRALYQNYLVMQTLFFFSSFFALLTSYVLPFSSIIMTEQAEGKADVPQPPADIPARGAVIAIFLVGFLIYGISLIITFWATRKESRPMMFAGLGGQICYIALSCYYVYLLQEVCHMFSTLTRDGDAAVLLPVKTIFQTLIASLLVLASFAYSIVVFLGFGKGLKEIHAKQPMLQQARLDLSME